jgi:hypothetical protein
MALWVAVILTVAIEQAPQTPRQTPRVQVADSSVLHRVKSAVIGAKARLDRPECQRLLTDFQDTDGRPLLENLGTSSLTPSDYLFERIWFVDGGDTPQCRRDQAMAAFTMPGHQGVWICSNRFAPRFARQATAAELIVIHEMLHTLGLAENPPSTSQITEQVTRRCGGS